MKRFLCWFVAIVALLALLYFGFPWLEEKIAPYFETIISDSMGGM